MNHRLYYHLLLRYEYEQYGTSKARYGCAVPVCVVREEVFCTVLVRYFRFGTRHSEGSGPPTRDLGTHSGVMGT